MKAYKCDHCGKILTPAESDQTFTIKVKKTGVSEKIQLAAKFHVCEKCLETLADWLDTEVDL